MGFHQVTGHTRWSFADLRELLAKATPPRSGDALAGLGAGSAEENLAAKLALADLPLRVLLDEPVVPYEADEVTRLICDSHDAGSGCGSCRRPWRRRRTGSARSPGAPGLGRR